MLLCVFILFFLDVFVGVYYLVGLENLEVLLADPTVWQEDDEQEVDQVPGEGDDAPHDDQDSGHVERVGDDTQVALGVPK